MATIGDIGVKTISKASNHLTVVWPDIVGAYDGSHTEVTLWEKESEARIYYHRLFSKGSGEPYLPWLKITCLLIIVTIVSVLFNHWLVIGIGIALFIFITLALLAVNMRRLEPLAQGKGNPSLIVAALGTGSHEAFLIVKSYLRTTDADTRARQERELTVLAQKIID